MLELGDVCWTVLVQRATSLLLQWLTRGTSVPCGIWPNTSSVTGYHGHGTDLYLPSSYIPNKPNGQKPTMIEIIKHVVGESALPTKPK